MTILITLLYVYVWVGGGGDVIKKEYRLRQLRREKAKEMGVGEPISHCKATYSREGEDYRLQKHLDVFWSRSLYSVHEHYKYFSLIQTQKS